MIRLYFGVSLGFCFYFEWYHGKTESSKESNICEHVKLFFSKYFGSNLDLIKHCPISKWIDPKLGLENSETESVCCVVHLYMPVTEVHVR